MDIDADKTKVLLQHYVRLGGPKELSASSPTLKRPKQIHFIYLSLEKILKPEGKNW